MYAAEPAGGADGVVRGGLRGVLSSDGGGVEAVKGNDANGAAPLKGLLIRVTAG